MDEDEGAYADVDVDGDNDDKNDDDIESTLATSSSLMTASAVSPEGSLVLWPSGVESLGHSNMMIQ